MIEVGVARRLRAGGPQGTALSARPKAGAIRGRERRGGRSVQEAGPGARPRRARPSGATRYGTMFQVAIIAWSSWVVLWQCMA